MRYDSLYESLGVKGLVEESVWFLLDSSENFHFLAIKTNLLSSKANEWLERRFIEKHSKVTIFHNNYIEYITVEMNKVKCTLVQALRLCTGRTAYRGSRVIGKGKVHRCTGTEALYWPYGL